MLRPFPLDQILAFFLRARLNFCRLGSYISDWFTSQCYPLSFSTWQVWPCSVVLGNSNGSSGVTLNLKQPTLEFSSLQLWQKHLQYFLPWQARTSLPGIALAQRTTVTSCLSPSSLRLVSKDAGLSGSAWSCPALTTAGSMVCRMLSRERQERRVGGMPRARAWDAANQTHRILLTANNILWQTIFSIEFAWFLSWCDTNPHFEPWQLHFRARRLHLSSRPFLLFLRAPREPEVAPPLRSLSVRLPSACDLEAITRQGGDKRVKRR